MEKGEVINELNKIFIDVLDNSAIVLNEQSSAANIEEWDSLNHILLVVEIEKHFKIKFTSVEIQNWANVGELTATILNKLHQK